MTITAADAAVEVSAAGLAVVAVVVVADSVNRGRTTTIIPWSRAK
jgi:hypothetical protein